MSETRWSIQSVPLGHEINADAVTFRRNAKLAGNALSQLTDAITLWAERRGTPPPPAGQQATPCPECNGTGSVDSGGFEPWGKPIDVACPACAPPASEKENRT